MVIKIANANGGFGHTSISMESASAAFDSVAIHSPASSKLASIQSNNASKMSPNTNSNGTKPIKLQNVASGEVTTDTLHLKTVNQPQSGSVCPVDSVCYGSLMKQTKEFFPLCNEHNKQILAEAIHFFEQYFSSLKQLNTSAHQKRIQEIEADIETNGTYDFTPEELLFGAKLAWRNASRCIGRIQWQKLQLFDMRNCQTTKQMFDAICNHIKYATNGGNLRSTITVFPQRLNGRQDFRVWNPQLIAYAGYDENNEHNSSTNTQVSKCPIKGDPANVEFTKICRKLGWKGSGSKWDILPIVISVPGQDPELFSIPEEIILRIPIVHPKFDWFQKLDLQWYALPAVANMKFDIGGVEFPACPFSGWYMDTEVAVRDLSDVQRYNILPLVAKYMELDTRSNASLWKDRAVVEVNIAVLYSYQKANVTIVDHYTASEQFMKHLENENRLRGGCPADWVWIVPPISGSLTPVFHQEMLNYELKPAYVYQQPPWKTHVWNNQNNVLVKKEKSKKLSFKTVAQMVRLMSYLFVQSLNKRVKCTILFASETGKSEQFAKRLSQIFSHAFNVLVHCMDSYDPLESLTNESLLFIVTSTFGNGDAPENGESLAKQLHARGILKFTGKFGVFALGSSAYPHFCAFGKNLDVILNELGGERIVECGTGDELSGQEQSFNEWAQQAFDKSCGSFGLVQNDRIKHLVRQSSLFQSQTWSKDNVKLEESNGHSQVDKSQRIESALTKLSHNKRIVSYKLLDREFLNESTDGRQDQSAAAHTIRITLKTDHTNDEYINYLPGDHLAVYPHNDPLLVSGIIGKITENNLINVDTLYSIKIRDSNEEIWKLHDKLPNCVSLREALVRYLDIATPPSQQLLKILADACNESDDSDRLKQLSEDSTQYDHWKAQSFPNFLDVLNQFPSVKPSAELLLTQLPTLQPRYYSISSSPLVNSIRQLELTIALVQYQTPNGVAHRGVCSHYLGNIPLNRTVYGFIRSAPNFRLPNEPELPIIMIGPGTGIAPFRGFWQHRAAQKAQLGQPANGMQFGEMTLFFGCRYPSMQLYKREIESQMKKEKTITKYHVAYSRKHGKPKRYVQDELKCASKAIYQTLMNKNCHVYVCGDVAMAEDVNRTLKWILLENGVRDVDSALHKLKENLRYHEDIFGNTKRNRSASELNNDDLAGSSSDLRVTFSQKRKFYRFWRGFC